MFFGLTFKRDNPLVRANSIHTPWCFSTTVVTLVNNSGCAVCSAYRFLLLQNCHRVYESYNTGQECKNTFVLCSCFHM